MLHEEAMLFSLHKKRSKTDEEKFRAAQHAKYYMYLCDKLYQGRLHYYAYLFGYFTHDFEPSLIGELYFMDAHSM